MSQENVEVVRRCLEAWNRGDLDAWVELFDEQAEFFALRSQLEGEPYRGHEGLRQFLVDFDGEWEYVRFSRLEIRDAGEQVVALAQWDARGRASGIELHVPVGLVATVRRGRIINLRFFSDPEEALKAVGLSE